MAPRGCDDDLPMIHMFTENYFWLATCMISDEIKLGYGCLSSPRCLHIPFLKPRRQLGNGNKTVTTVCEKLSPQSWHLPRFPGFLRVTVQNSSHRGAFCFSRRLPRAAAQPVCQFKPKILRIDSLPGHVILLLWSTLLPSLHQRPCFLEVQSYYACSMLWWSRE
jgi:hypothetical protein